MSVLDQCLQVDYAIASGFDNELDLFILDGVTVDGDSMAFQTPFSFGSYNPGTIIITGDQSIAFDGFPSIVWTFSYLTYLQLQYLRDNYANGGWSGQVTISTLTDNPTEMQIWNAIARFTVLSGSRLLRPGYDSYAIAFILQEKVEAAFTTAFSLAFDS